MSAPITAIAIFVVVFAIATARNVHLGVAMFAAGCGVGVVLADMPLREVVAGFPIGIMVLLAGVTYFFGIAQINGTIDRLIGAVLTHAGARPVALPFVFFALTGTVAAMGSPQAGLVLAPVAMPVARRTGVDSMAMAMAVSSGISAGGFAPTSLFGIVTYRTAQQAGIDLSPFTLLGVTIAMNLALLVAALWMFRGTHQSERAVAPAGFIPAGKEIVTNAGETARRLPLERHHIATMVCMIGLVISVVASALAGFEPDIGVIAFSFGAVLALLDPASGAAAVSKIDWSTVLVVGGIVTFVGVLQKLGAVNLLAQAAMDVGTPLVAAFVICMIAGLASAFASTTGILAALVPMAVPLAVSGNVAGWALISALGVCASIVDISPFSTTGATLVASAAEEERPRLRSLTARWGMSMVVVGPAILVAVLVLLGS